MLGRKEVSAVPSGQGTAGPPFCRADQNAQQDWPPLNMLFCQSPLVPPTGWERDIVAEKSCLEVESGGASGEASLGVEKPFPHQSLGFPPPLNFPSLSIIFNCIFSVKTLLRDIPN